VIGINRRQSGTVGTVEPVDGVNGKKPDSQGNESMDEKIRFRGEGA
jgi:hypothetical protein